MAHKNVDYKPEDIQFPNQKIVQSELVHEMQSSYIEYAMSVIVGRALPDVRDGLKPVHRRILYAMYEDGLTSDKAFKKSATCVGDVLGRYHPHGDASVYDALVRLAQDFSMRYMLVDGHGNFGSIDGDPPAAYRYTEARMSKIANEMLRDIDKETVDWDPNFDESRKEPRVLPARFPNLLVNGSSGIAVGMATNIPPHNLTEVINACVCVLDNPEATLYDLMQHVTGPDFPTKGIIMGRSGIRAAYATGRGKIILRARTEFEEFGRDRTRIIVTELPYQVNKRMLIKNMADQVNDKRLEGISDIRDETDRTGMRIVIEVKHDANPQVVLNRLFAQTQLQTSFAINMLALVDNQKQPKILSLRHIIDEYLTFQEELITRRTQYDLKKAREREHLLQGLLIAQDNIDEVIHIIRTSYDDAKEKLMERFSLSDVQAQAILDMRLKALQGLDREKLQNEYDELEKKIAYFVELLSNETMLKGVLKDELIEIRDKYGDERKTEIQEVEDEIEAGFEICRGLVEKTKADKRQPLPLAYLKVGLKCGGSDGFSGITANPLVGLFSDWLIAQGGTTVLTEVPEMFGAETILMDRAADRRVFDGTVSLINDFKRYFRRFDQPIYENPSPGNKKGGITTLEEKSLGCVQKGGAQPVVDVLTYAQPVTKPGLNLLQAPGNDLVAASALALSGCQLVLFTTGRGTPFGSFVPTMKISTNTQLAEFKANWIDFNAGTLVEDEEPQAVLERFIGKVLATAGGERLKHEETGFKEIAIFKTGVTL